MSHEMCGYCNSVPCACNHRDNVLKTERPELVVGRVFPVSSADRRAEREILEKLIKRSQTALDFSDDVDPASHEKTAGDILRQKAEARIQAVHDKTIKHAAAAGLVLDVENRTQTIGRGKIEEILGQGADGGGMRLNAGKNRIELLPPEWLWALADVMTQGSRKYPPRNWEKGMDWSSMIGCMYRHIAKFQGGQRFDGACFDKNEGTTGCHELAMVAWNALALMVYDLRNIGNNDLPIIDQLDLFDDVNAATSTLEMRWEHDRITPPEPGDMP